MGERTPEHEAGHAAVCRAIGWPVGPLTARPGPHSQGTCLYYVPKPAGDMPDPCIPFSMWPPAWQAWASGSALISAAGDIAAQLFGPRETTRVEEDSVTVAVAALEAGEPDDAELADLAEVMSAPEGHVGDAEKLTRLAWRVNGGDPLAAAAWLGFIGADARRILLAEADGLLRLADLARSVDVVPARAVAACLDRSE